ncbi:TPA: pilus assembly/adherence protein PilC, partial [Neisseria gonorrhoeae]
MNGQNQPEVRLDVPSSIRNKDRKREYTHHKYKTGGGSVSFNNSDELVSRQSGTAVFGTATYLPPYGKVSGFDADALKERNNAVDWIRTTRIALAGYSYAGVICKSGNQCPQLVYETKFAFGQQGLQRKGNKLDIYEDKSRDNSPIYKLKDYPWLGVSFNLGSENTVKNSRSFNKLISSFNEDNNNQTIVSTTRDHPISLGDSQREHTAVAYYLNAKLHLLDKKRIEDIAQGKTVDLGTLRPRVETKTNNWGNLLSFWAKWDIKDNGQIPVKLGLPQVKAGRCTNAAHPNPKVKPLSPALTAPALWFGPAQNGKVQMYSASVSTYPGSSSSKIFLQNLSRNDDKNKPGRYSLKPLSENEIKSKEPSFMGRQTIIRLDDGVHLIRLSRSKDEVIDFVNLNGNNTGKNDTFGIVKEANVNLEADEWKKVLLPWTVRGPGNDDKFKSINREPGKYSQRYRIRENSNRDLGDIVNSPIVAVGEYLATAANDGMVHIFKKNGGSDERSYNLKLSYIPGTMPRKDIESKDSTLAKELRTFAEKGYVGDRYGVDGGFVLRQVELRGQKHVFMFGAMGLGGRGAYALDLSKINGNYPAAAP